MSTINKILLFASLVLSGGAFSQSGQRIYDETKIRCATIVDETTVMIDCAKAKNIVEVSIEAEGEYSRLKTGDGKCLDIYYRNDSRAPASIRPCNDAGNQRWKIEKQANGSFKFRYKNDLNKCLDLDFYRPKTDGAKLQLFDCEKRSPSQNFHLLPN